MQVIKEFPVDFFGETLTGYLTEEGHASIPLRRLCESLGIEVSSQRQRILHNPVLAESLIPLMIPTEFRNRIRLQKVLCLDSKKLFYWLSTLDTSRIKPEKRDQIIAYQRQLADMTGYIFMGKE